MLARFEESAFLDGTGRTKFHVARERGLRLPIEVICKWRYRLPQGIAEEVPPIRAMCVVYHPLIRARNASGTIRIECQTTALMIDYSTAYVERLARGRVTARAEVPGSVVLPRNRHHPTHAEDRHDAVLPVAPGCDTSNCGPTRMPPDGTRLPVCRGGSHRFRWPYTFLSVGLVGRERVGIGRQPLPRTLSWNLLLNAPAPLNVIKQHFAARFRPAGETGCRGAPLRLSPYPVSGQETAGARFPSICRALAPLDRLG